MTPTEPWKPESGLVLLAQLASLAATGWIVWSIAVHARPHPQSLPGVVIQAVMVGLLAFVCSGIFMTAFQLVNARRLGFDTLRVSLRTAQPSIWLAPTAILLSRSSPFAVGAALALVIATTQMLYSQWVALERVTGPIPGGSNTWPRACAIGIALGSQTTIVCLWIGAPLLAVALLCLSAAGLTLMCLVADAYRAREPSTLPDSLLRIFLTLILGVGLTVGDRLGAWFKFSTSGDADPKTRPELITKLYEPAGSVRVTDKSYQGVILWPEVKATQKLVAPPPLRRLASLSPAVPPSPFQIPFSGPVLDVQASPSRAAARLVFSQIGSGGSFLFNHGPKTDVYESAPETGACSRFGMLRRNTGDHLKRGSTIQEPSRWSFCFSTPSLRAS